jgi:ribonuclease HI
MELPFEPSPRERNDRELLAAMRALEFPDRAPKGVLAIYTDGACSGNPGPGGWAWAVAPDGVPSDSGTERPSTNQRMEIRAAIEALRAHRTYSGPINIVSDSTYVVNCFRQRWWQGWLSRGWLNSQKKPVANQDLWHEMLHEVVLRGSGNTIFSWVKGHSGDPMNDLVDALAVAAAGA